MSAFTYGEVCAGVGGMSRGLEAGGMAVRFHAEIAAFPRRVLAHRWPDTPLLSDLNAISGGRKMRAYMRRHFSGLTLLAGGTPCQDLSVAGKRAGIFGLRSSLYFRFVRLWKVLDCPYILWENVAGALSSNRGADFALVLSAIVGGPVPVPGDGWARAGVVAGPTGVAAWRLLDAQWFGVPQRRLRVFVLGARAGGVDPAAVLLEPEGVRGNPPARGEARERVADSLTVGANQTCGFPGDVVAGGCDDDGLGSGVTGTITSNGDAHRGIRDADGLVLSFDWQKGNDVTNARPSTMNVTEEQTGTLGATRVPAVLSFGWQNAAAQGDDVSHGSDAPMRTGTVPAVLAFDTQQITSPTNRSRVEVGQPSPTLHQRGSVHDVDAPPAVAIPLQEVGKRTGVSTTDTRCGLGIGVAGDPMFTLQAGAQHGVVCTTGDVTHSLTHEGHDASEDGTGRGTPIVVDAPAIARCVTAGEGQRNDWETCTLVVGTLDSREHGGGFPGSDDAMSGHVQPSNGVPRRLMPVECERLMGWPDGWTDVPDEKGKPASDAVRYKACGNGVVSHCSEWIGARLVTAHAAMLAGERAA